MSRVRRGVAHGAPADDERYRTDDIDPVKRAISRNKQPYATLGTADLPCRATNHHIGAVYRRRRATVLPLITLARTALCENLVFQHCHESGRQPQRRTLKLIQTQYWDRHLQASFVDVEGRARRPGPATEAPFGSAQSCGEHVGIIYADR